VSAAERARSVVTHGAVWSLLYVGAARLGTFGVSVEVARLLGPAGAGAFGVALQASGLATLVGAFGVGQALAQRVAQAGDDDRIRRLCRAAFGIVLAGTTLVALVLALVAHPLARSAYRDVSLGATLLWCAPLTVATGLFFVSEGAMQGLRRFHALALWGAGTAVADLTLGYFAAQRGIEWVYAARVLVRAVAAAIGLRLALRGVAPRRAAGGAADSGPAVVHLLLRFAGPTFVGATIVVLGQTLVRLLLIRGSGLGPAGHFQVADTVGQGLATIPLAASLAFLPTVARDHVAGAALAPSLERALRGITGFNLPLCLGVIALGPILVPLVFGARYGPATGCLQVLAVAYAVATACSVLGTAALGRAEVGTIVGLNGLWLVVLVWMLLAGQSARGAEGGAVALAVAYVAYLLPCVVVAARRWRVAPGAMAAPVLCSIGLPVLALVAMRTPQVPAWLGIGFSLAAALAVFRYWAWNEAVGLVRGRALFGLGSGTPA
jgi:O-antigen/teichoic acid export membrane protein